MATTSSSSTSSSMIIKFIATNGYKITYEDLNKDDTIDKLKLRIYREHSDHLPIPSNIFLDAGDNEKNKEKQEGEEESNKDDSMQVDNENTNLKPSILHPFQIRLLYSGKQLSNYSTLEENSIASESTIVIAISPFYSLRKELDYKTTGDKMNVDREDSTSVTAADELIVSNKNGINNFTLAVNDHSAFEIQKFSVLDHLTDLESSSLLTRVKSDPKPTTTTTTTTTTTNQKPKYAQLVQSSTKFKVIKDTDSLETKMDRLSLEKKSDIERVEILQSPLEIVTFTPTGSIDSTARISVVFNRSFIPITTNLSSNPVPLSISPEVPNGKWQWIDGVTCTYAASDNTQFPKSTKYVITTLPEIFKNHYNETFEQKSWEIITATQYLTFPFYNGSVESPEVVLKFSQLFPKEFLQNKKKICEYFHFQLDLEPFTFELISDPELLTTKSRNQLDKPDIIPDDTLIFKLDYLDGEIPNDSEIEVQILSGIPSAEGPLKTTSLLMSTFYTPPSLSITPNHKYPDTFASFVSFASTVPLKTVDFKNLSQDDISSYVSIKPAVKVTNISASTYITISANFEFKKSYSVTVKNFEDMNGQRIKPTTGNFSFSEEPIEFKITQDFSNEAFFNLDPLSKPVLQILSKGLSSVNVSVYKPNTAFQTKFFNLTHTQISTVAKEVNNASINIDHIAREYTSTLVDLSKYFGAISSDAVTTPLLYFLFNFGKNRVGKWVQYTPYVPSILSHGNDISAWVYDAHTNNKIVDFKCSLLTPGTGVGAVDAVTDAQSNTSTGLVILDKRKSAFSALLFKTPIQTVFKFNFSLISTEPSILWETFDECGYYKPGDTVSIRGIVRSRDPETSAISLPKVNEIIKYKVVDPRRVEKCTGQTKIDENGTFTVSFALPLDTNLGSINVTFEGLKSSYSHSFQLQEFKLKQFLVESRAHYGKSSHIMENDKFSVEVCGKSYTDEVLSNTQVDWKVSLIPISPMTLPTGYDYRSEVDSTLMGGPYNLKSKRIISGHHKMDFVLQDLGSSYNVNISGIIKDITNVSESFSHHFTVYSKQLFLGISKQTQSYLNIDESLSYSMLVSDSIGKLSNQGSIKFTIKKVPWEEDLPLQLILERDISPSSEGPVDFSHKFESTGFYKIYISYTAPGETKEQLFTKDLFILGQQSDVEKEYKEIKPPLNLTSQTKLYSTSPLYASKPHLDLKILIKEPKDSYLTGEDLNLVITSGKIQSGSGFLIICNNLSQIERIPLTLENGSVSHTYKVKATDFPAVTFRVYIQGVVKMSINNQPVSRISSQFASTRAVISLDSKKLNVSIVDFRKFQTPGEDSKISVLVKNNTADKTIKNAIVTLAIVDEALIDISKYSVANWNPISTFYPSYGQSGMSYSLLDSTIFQDPKKQDEVIPMEVTPVDNQITIKYFSGRFIIFKVSNSISIEELRKLIQERDGLPPSYQRLFYQNKPITENDNQKYLSDFGVPNGSTLNLVIRLAGGSGSGSDDKPDPEAKPAKVIRLRENFQSVAYFGSRNTDQDGLVTFNCKLPDNLTSYKIMAYAYTVGEFGASEETFTSTLPVMIRPSPPRFLNYNDECIFPINVQSIVNFDLDVNIAIDSTTCKIEQSGFKGKLGPFARLTIPCKVKALVPNQVTQFRCVVQTLTKSGEELSDAINFKFPVASPASIEGMSINDHLTDNSKEYSSHPVTFSNWTELDQQVGGLKLNLSMSPLSKVHSCVSNLVFYEHSCSEQISSKLLPLAIMKSQPKLFDSIELPESNIIFKMIEKLKLRFDNKKKTFRYWDSPTANSYDYVNLYVYWVLDLVSKILPETAAELKFVAEASNIYVTNIINSFSMSDYKKEKKHYLSKMAFACFVSKNTTKATALAEKILKLASTDYPNDYVDILAYIIPYVKNSKEFGNINNLITITGSLAYIKGSNIDGFMSVSRCNAIIVGSLLQINPSHKLIPKLLAGLSKNIDSYNTQDNAFALYAMYQYQKSLTDKSTKTNFSVYLNQFQLDGPKELTLDSPEITLELPMSTLLKNQGQLFIEKLDKSNLFYSVGLQYALKNPFYQEIKDRGFSIKRTYKGINNASDVDYPETNNNNKDENIITIKAGSKVKVQLDIHVRDLSSFVVIRDFLPSGLEPTLHNRKSYWQDHLNIRDKGCEAFADRIYPGTYTFTYIVDALTLGTYIAPPSTIQEMYCLTSMGRSKTEIIIIK